MAGVALLAPGHVLGRGWSVTLRSCVWQAWHLVTFATLSYTPLSHNQSSTISTQLTHTFSHTTCSHTTFSQATLSHASLSYVPVSHNLPSAISCPSRLHLSLGLIGRSCHVGFSGPLILNDYDGGWVSVMPLAMRCRFKQIQRAHLSWVEGAVYAYRSLTLIESDRGFFLV